MLDATAIAPPIPPEADLRDFPFMPLEIARLRRSKAWLYCKRRPELAFYMLNLWTAAWHDRPAGSLENDDDVLGDLAMCSVERWPKVREPVLRGWARHADGRIYHPVVTEKVLDAWRAKLASRERTLRARIAALQKRISAATDENAKSLMLLQLDELLQQLSAAESQKKSQVLSAVTTETNRERKGEGERNRKGEGEGYISGARPGNCEQPDPSPGPAVQLGPVELHERFERVMAAYPKFVGAADLMLVERECRKRIDEGATWDELLAAAERFAAFVKAGGRSGPGFVDSPLNFFKSNKWRDEWAPPPTKAEQRLDGNIAAAAEAKRRILGGAK